VRFNLTDTTGLVAWSVDCVRVTSDCPTGIQTRSTSEGSQNVGVGIDTTVIPIPIPANQFNTAIAKGTGVPAGVTFDGMGRTLNATGDITRIDVTNQVVTSSRRYVIMIDPGGQIRMCDPAVSFSSNPQGCS
jgi:type IV fimbrial biogenesis protein FimT